jgi:predicted Ser/Thr protein kinase
MRPELDDTLAVGAASPDPAQTATAPRAAAGDAPGLVAGQQLGHFRIERPLGAGGMGEVYLATDLALDRPVAIKVLPAGSARDPARRERLVREARSQARVTHPNVGHIYFIGEEAGRLYFAMEYVAGTTLAARVADGPLPAEDALSIIRSAALGLREAQRNGITHRDIKPSNLMIDGHGIVKLLDFGLAATTGASAGSLGSGPVAQTSLAGTPLYMAPEQARGEPIDFRSDIYALGATLFHLVSGHPPFEADSLDVLLSRHASAERPSLPRRSGQPRTAIAAIDALCNRMMALAPGERFASYDELIRAIELASLAHLRPAGFWVRTMTALADLLFASLVVLAVLGLLELVGAGPPGDNSPFIFAIYLISGSLLIARYGRTLGQAIFELEVVDVATGGRPTLGRAAIRIVLPIAITFIGTVIKYVLARLGYELWGVASAVFPAALLLSGAALLWASLRSHGKQAIWDRLSRTMVRYRTQRTTAL